METVDQTNYILEEQVYFLRVIKTLKSYKKKIWKDIQDTGKTLPQIEQQKLTINHDKLLLKMINFAMQLFNKLHPNGDLSKLDEINILENGHEKVAVIFESVAREWSIEGLTERQQCFDPIIEEIIAIYPENEYTRAEMKILVPGAGLGRLPIEIASRGFKCEGNEFNLLMIIMFYFIFTECLNSTWITYPWIINASTSKSKFQEIQFPDIKPKITSNLFSMTAGDFLESYIESEWDCLTTCFFIDCSPNPLIYIKKIFNILKPGGRWINLGPLAYDQSQIVDEKYKNFDSFCKIIKTIGFEIEKYKSNIETQYCQDPDNSMPQRNYNSVFFVCRKPTSSK